MKALPALYKKPNVTTNDATASVTVSWDNWSQDIDYGTGPVAYFIVHYGKGTFTDTLDIYNTVEVTIPNLSRGPDYIIAVGVVGKDNAEGMLSPTVTSRIKCNSEIQINKEK